MRKHTTKHALVMSALSLLVCVSMLVGSTFAWFTDSVSSDRNIIQAGNLDVTLEYWDGDSYEEVTSSTKLFNDAALWEPGHAEVAYLRIDNAGSLALKYQLAVNVYNETPATNVAGETFKLSDHLVFSVVDKALTSRDDMFTREQAIAAAGNAMGLSSYNSGTVEMLPIDEPDCVALIIYMPTSVGNEANYRGAAPTIELGTTLVATQMASEQDSWDNSFDLEAPYPVLSLPAPMPETGAAAEDIVLNTEKGTETGIPAELVADIADEYPEAEELRLTHTEPVIDTTAKTVTFTHFDIVDEKGNVIDLEAMNNTTPVTVVVSVVDAFAEGDVVVIYHDKEAVASAVVSADKTVTYTTTHFCEVVVSTGDGTIDSAAELAAAVAAGGTIKLEQNVVLTEQILIPAGTTVTLDLNGKTITSAMTSGRAIVTYGALTLKNGSIVTNNGVNGVYTTGSNASLTLTDMVIDVNGTGTHAEWNHAAIGAAGGASVTINSGTYSAEVGYGLTVMTSGAHIIINDGTFTTEGTSNSVAVRFDSGWDSSKVYTSAIINGGTFNAPEGGWAFTATNAYGKDIVINGGTFNGKVASHYQDNGVVINGGIFNGKLLEGGGHTDKYLICGGTFVEDLSSKLAEGYVATKNADGTWKVAPPAVSTPEEFLDVVTNQGGAISIDGKIVVDELWLQGGVKKGTTIVGGTISRDTGNGNGLYVYTTEPVVFKGVKLETVKGNYVLDVNKAGANVTLENCVIENFAAPSTGNTAIHIQKADNTIVFNNCTFKNAPIVIESTALNLKLEFNNCTFIWEGPNCPGMIKMSNSATVDIDFNDCKCYFNAQTASKGAYFVSTPSKLGVTTIDFNNFDMVCTAKNCAFVSQGGYTTQQNMTVTASGNVTYSLDGVAGNYTDFLVR